MRCIAFFPADLYTKDDTFCILETFSSEAVSTFWNILSQFGGKSETTQGAELQVLSASGIWLDGDRDAYSSLFASRFTTEYE
jgi:hypothetical protein